MLNKTELDEKFMRRCFDLARLGRGYVAPNPEVGAVLVCQNRIIGEGFHQRYGHAHAEVNAVHSVSPGDRELIPKSTLYVSLEPCCFHGQTPACTTLILKQQIPRVVISCLDNTPEVAGKGVQILREAGVEVSVGVLEEEGRRLARVRRVIAEKNRPYVMLKFAQTQNGFFAPFDPGRQWISHPLTKRLTHKWRAEVDAILIGRYTAQIDDPKLTTRHYFGPSPLRIVLDPKASLPPLLRLFQDGHPTWRVVDPGISSPGKVKARTLAVASLPELLTELLENQVGTLLVEGGAKTLRRFLAAGLWDEARVLTGPGTLDQGVAAPLPDHPPLERYRLGNNLLEIYTRTE